MSRVRFKGVRMNIQSNLQLAAKQLRGDYGLTVYDVAEILGVCPQQVIAWLKGNVVE